jgi:hypothetical protein
MCTESSKTQVHGTRNPSFTVYVCVCVHAHKHAHRESVHVCTHACIKLYIYMNTKKLNVNSNSIYIIDFITMAFSSNK